jgi:hypothetical protein
MIFYKRLQDNEIAGKAGEMDFMLPAFVLCGIVPCVALVYCNALRNEWQLQFIPTKSRTCTFGILGNKEIMNHIAA